MHKKCVQHLHRNLLNGYSIINDLNGAFANARIQFVLLGSDFINSNKVSQPSIWQRKGTIQDECTYKCY